MLVELLLLNKGRQFPLVIEILKKANGVFL